MAPAHTVVSFLDEAEAEALLGLLDTIPADMLTLPPGIPNCKVVKIAARTSGEAIHALVTLAPVTESTELVTGGLLERAHLAYYGCLPAYSTLFCASSMVCPSNCFPTPRGLFATRGIATSDLVTLALLKPARDDTGKEEGDSLEVIAGTEGDARCLVGGNSLNPLWAINDSPHDPNVQFTSLSAAESGVYILNHLSRLGAVPPGLVEEQGWVEDSLLVEFGRLCHRGIEVMLQGDHPIAPINSPPRGSSNTCPLESFAAELQGFLVEHDLECCICTSLRPILEGEEIYASYNFEHSGTGPTLDPKSPECLVRYIDTDDSVKVGVFSRVRYHDGDEGRPMVSLTWDEPYTSTPPVSVELGQFNEDRLVRGRVRPYLREAPEETPAINPHRRRRLRRASYE